HGEARAVELPGEGDRDAAVPFDRIALFHAARGSSAPRVVHYAVAPTAQRGEALVEEGLDLLAVGDVAGARGERGVALRERPERLRIHVADVDLGALARERSRDGKADAGCSGGDHYAQITDFQVHGYTGSRRHKHNIRGDPP